MSMKFNSGDQVKVLDHLYDNFKGKIGTVIKYDGALVVVYLPWLEYVDEPECHSCNVAFSETQLEKIK